MIIEDELQNSYPFKCKKTDKFSSLESKYFEKEPSKKNKIHYYTLNNKKIDISKTLEENNIPDGSIIYYKEGQEEENNVKKEDEGEEICVIISSMAQDFKSSFICKNTDKFKVLEQQLYNRKPDLKDKFLYFLCKGNSIETEKTIKENKIKDSDIIMYNIFD